MTQASESGPGYASAVDYGRYGHYGQGRGFDAGQSFQRPRYQFRGRITADGSSGYRAEPGRYTSTPNCGTA
jgi:glutathione S-transferase/putative glutathione S-transferase